NAERQREGQRLKRCQSKDNQLARPPHEQVAQSRDRNTENAHEENQRRADNKVEFHNGFSLHITKSAGCAPCTPGGSTITRTLYCRRSAVTAHKPLHALKRLLELFISGRVGAA